MAIKQTKAASASSAAPVQAQANAEVNWEQYSGITGFDNVQQSDLGIPFLTIIQSKSAEVDKTHKDYAIKKIEGAEAGDIINSVSRKIIAKVDKGFIRIVPAFYEKTYIEWKPNRGGMVKVHRNPAILEEVTGQDEKKQNILRNGNLLIETASFYIQLLEEGSQPTPAVINMISTQLKNARLWLNLALGIKLGPNKITPPLFSHSYLLSTVIERKENNAWYGWKIQVGDMVKDQALITSSVNIGQRVKLSASPKPTAIAAPVEHDEVPM